MSYEYLTSPEQFWSVLEKQILPYYKSQEKPLFYVDFETYSYYTDHSTLQDLYKIPTPIRIPPRQVCRLWDKKEFTMEFESYTSLLQLGADVSKFDKQWIFDIKKIGEDVIAEGLREILENSTLVGHNLKYEEKFFITQYNIWPDPEKVRDTQLIEQLIIAGRKDKTALGECYKRYFDFGWFIAETGKSFYDYDKLKKEMQQSDWSKDLDENQLQYACDDVRLIHFLYKQQKEHLSKFLKHHPRSSILDEIKFECSLIEECALIELRGIELDLEYHKEKIIPFLERKQKEAYDLAVSLCPNVNPIKMKGRGVNKREYQELPNFNSSTQVPKILALLGIKVPNAQEDTLKAVRSQHPVVQAILNYKKTCTLLNSFGYKLPRFVHEDGKLHAEFRQIGTETFRFSGSNPNLQQIPKKGKLFEEQIKVADFFRKLFVVLDPEQSLIDSDFATEEPRLLAQGSRDEMLIKLFNEKIDYYSFNAKNFLNLDYLPEKGSYEREVIGKVGTLAMQYLAGDPKTAEFMFTETLDEEFPVKWTPDEAKLKKEAFFSPYPQVKELIEKTRREVYDHFYKFESLAEFKGRRPIFTAFIDGAVQKEFKGKFRRHRQWFLTEAQEAQAKYKAEGDPRNHPLHKDYVTYEEIEDPETGEIKVKKSYWNQFKQLQNSMIRELYNFRIQCPAALILKNSIKKLSYRELKKYGFDPLREGIVIHLHDEILFRTDKLHEELAFKLVHDAMVSSGEMFINVVPVIAEPSIGRSWNG